MRSNQSLTQYTRWRKWREIIEVWGLVIPGFAGILISIIDLIFSPSKDLVINALLFLFSILALAIGLQRYDVIGGERTEAQERYEEIAQAFARLDKEILEVHRTLGVHIRYKVLDTVAEVYEEARRLIERCKGSEIIRTTSVGSILDTSHSAMYDGFSQEASYKTYLETLARRIGEAKLQSQNMQYHVIVGFQPDAKGEPPLDKREGIRKRIELFKENGAYDRLQIRSLPTSWSLDVLIVGDEHILIGFPTITGDRQIRLGIRITDKALVKQAIQWYNEHLWNVATPVTWTGEETK